MATIQEHWKRQLENQWGLFSRINEDGTLTVFDTDAEGRPLEWSFDPGRTPDERSDVWSTE